MFNNLGNLADLMKNAGKLRESMERATEALRLELVSIRIDPKLLADGDAELLEDLVLAAVNQGLIKAREAAAQSISSLAGGLPIPGLAGFLGRGDGGA